MKKPLARVQWGMDAFRSTQLAAGRSRKLAADRSLVVRNLTPDDLADVELIRSWLTEYRDDRTPRQLDAYLRRRDRVSYGAELVDGRDLTRQLAGYLVADVTPRRLKLVELAVDVPYQRQGVARALVAHLVARYGEARLLVARVRERNLDAQLFLCDGLGLEWSHTAPAWYSRPAEDGYVFRSPAGAPAQREAA